ncbi:MAG: 30S ribosomal protein S20 [Bacteroidota bacterium]
MRSNEAKRLRNRYYAKTTRNSIKALRAETSVAEAKKDLPTVLSNIDKLAKRNIIHKNKAANLKSKLMKKLNAMK